MARLEPKRISLKDGRSIVIRVGEPTDAGALLTFLDRILTDGEGMVLEAGEMPKTLDQEEGWISGMLDAEDQLLLLAEHDGEIVGNLDFHLAQRRRLRHGGQFGISILPGWRAVGLGSALLGTLVDWAKSRERIERIALYALASNGRALGLYRKFGFVEEGRQINEVKLGPGRYVDNVLMALLLRGSVPSSPTSVPTLIGRHIALEPLSSHHVAELWPAANEPEIWTYLLHEVRTQAELAAWVEKRLRAVRDGTGLTFLLRDRRTGAAIGSSSIFDIDRQNRKMEVGHTWLGRSHRRTAANTEAKYLLLSHAFAAMQAVRVQLKCDARNVRSQAAIRRIGATPEGVLRSFLLLSDGHRRDTAMFSITETEWPSVRQRLMSLLED